MQMKTGFFLILSSLFFTHLSGQGDRGLRSGFDGLRVSKDCEECAQTIATKPNEVLFGLEVDDFGNVYFIVSDILFMDKLFPKGVDGIGVDVVLEEQYACGSENDFPSSSIRQGHLLPIIYQKDFKNDIIERLGHGAVKVGVIPEAMRNKSYQLNLLFVRDRSVCYYQNFFNLATTRWSLLETGLYMDTIAGITEESSVRNLPEETHMTLSKRMKFEIPFEKGKSEYSSEDIQPLYDSLRLTDFHILSAEILAYSSVEGTTEGNLRLQQKRAQSILEALNSFQDEEIEAKIDCAENWVEFINDMDRKGDGDLVRLNQSEIKKRLRDPKLSSSLEPILKNHRKAILILDLQKKSKYKGLSHTTVLALYEESLLESNLQSALEIQQELFTRVEQLQIPSSVLSSIEVPRRVEFGALLNNQAVFDYNLVPTNVLESLLAFRELEYLLPHDSHIKYNICVLETRAWLVGESSISPNELLRDIKRLSAMGIEADLVTKLKINYQIIASEYHMQGRRYEAKDESLNYIFRKYKTLDLKDDDLLSLSEYFSSYARYDWAEAVLREKVKNIDVNADLLFYFLNLTIIHPEYLNKPSYRTYLLNAVNRDKDRFCGLFQTIREGGISVHLLGSPQLKEVYCENCLN